MEPISFYNYRTDEYITRDMDLSHLVTKHILRVVLHLLRSPDVLHLFAGCFEQVLGGHLVPPHHQVQTGADLLQLHPGVLGAGLAEVDLVAPHQNLPLHRCELEDVFYSRQPEVVNLRSSEEIYQERFQPLELLIAAVGKGLSSEQKARLGARSYFGVLEFLEGDEIFQSQLEHVQQVVVIHPAQDDVVRPLLVVVAEHEQRTVILFAEKLQLGHIFKRADIILLVVADGVGLLQIGQI